ncbi:MAG TPA: flagellar hook-associated protein FlgL [Candidatus Hydrogenedentes bacterium]|nr:flagellar hook-associated protein FlgL [Candidatus Hydrogenedentota bacterium]HOL77483.1 flagellar hook-associated protein FlgL [Candidatus Hydrogenedentota bacterium]HPO86270.1 flagellar hook-associated protein FlgL [Candidatus Hydrogenedentota bacterium]
MSVPRITQRLMANRVLADLRTQTERLLRVQDQLATGQRITKPSDDPIDTRRAIDTRALIQKYQQYVDNVAMVSPQLDETTSMIGLAMSAVQRVHELTLQGANGTNSQEQMSYLAEEVNQVLEGVFQNANHVTNGRYIFAGTRSKAPAFSATRNVQGEITGVSYDGDSGTIEIALADNIQLRINEPGDRVFQGTVDIFQTFINIRDELRAGNRASLSNVRIGELDQLRSQLSQAQARVGALQNRVATIQNENEDLILQNQILQSQVLDADYADTIVNLNMQQNAYQAALNAAGRVLQPSLLDYVR